MLSRVLILKCCFYVLFSNFLLAQDQAFSLLYTAPSLINPAYSGLTEGLARFSGSHRLRRATETDNFNTSLFSADWSWRGNRYDEPDMVGGASLVAISDRAGGMTTTEFIGSASYEVPLGVKVRFHQLRGGIQVGMRQRSLDNPSLLFEDQFDGRGFNRGTGERFATTSVTNFDVSTGVVWYSTQNIPGNQEFNHFLGFSVHHINQAKSGFFEAEPERKTMRYSIMGGVKFRPGNTLLDNRLDFNLNGIYSIQNHSKLLTLSAFAKLTFFEKGRSGGKEKAGIFTGVTTKVGDAFAAFVGVDIARSISFAFSYDIIVSKNRIVPSSYGGVQFSISYLLQPVPFDITSYSKRDTPLPFPHF